MTPGRDNVPAPVRGGGAASAALLPLAWLYGAAVAADRRARAVARLDREEAPRVIAIGNLEVGGSGKTPLAMLLLERALARGVRAAYVSRGYASRAEHGPLVTLVGTASDDPAARAGERRVDRRHGDLAREIGDEGAVVASRVPEALLCFARDKRRAVAAAAAAGAALVVLDDAFQSRRVARHADIVLLDAQAPLGNGRVLPAGPLRERPSALAGADAVVFNGAADAAAVERAAGVVRAYLKPGARLAGLARRTRLLPGNPRAAGQPARVLAVSGIARPEGFAASLAAAGVECAGHAVFRDHHRYTRREAEALEVRVRALGADGIATTEKDWVKLSRLWNGPAVWVARLDVDLVGDELPR